MERGSRPMVGWRRAASMAALVAALVATGCGGDQPAPPNAGGIGLGMTTASLGKLNCSDWKAADPQTRMATVAQIREFAGGDISTGDEVVGRGAVLDDEQAYELFERRCQDDYASGFLLYKLYTHAAVFAGSTGS